MEHGINAFFPKPVLSTLDLHGVLSRREHYLLIEIPNPKLLLFGVLLILLSLIYKIIVFNMMLLVLNVCTGPPITLNWEQGCLNLSDSPAKREQIIFLPPTFLYHC